MRSASLSLLVVLALAAGAVAPRAQTKDESVKEADRIKAAITVLDEVMAAADSSMPRNILERAEAIAVFPSLVKAGFGVGGQFGRGVISARDPQTGPSREPWRAIPRRADSCPRHRTASPRPAGQSP